MFFGIVLLNLKIKSLEAWKFWRYCCLFAGWSTARRKDK